MADLNHKERDSIRRRSGQSLKSGLRDPRLSRRIRPKSKIGTLIVCRYDSAEHWKTARSALNRINIAFAAKGHAPHTFFIGAAVEAKMAGEIWESLNARTLENAANLTNENQIASITRWLCTL